MKGTRYTHRSDAVLFEDAEGHAEKLDFIGKANTEFDIVECRTDTTGFIQNMKKFFDTLRAGAIPKTSQSNAEITFETLEPYVKRATTFCISRFRRA